MCYYFRKQFSWTLVIHWSIYNDLSFLIPPYTGSDGNLSINYIWFWSSMDLLFLSLSSPSTSSSSPSLFFSQVPSSPLLYLFPPPYSKCPSCSDSHSYVQTLSFSTSALCCQFLISYHLQAFLVFIYHHWKFTLLSASLTQWHSEGGLFFLICFAECLLLIMGTYIHLEWFHAVFAAVSAALPNPSTLLPALAVAAQ